MNTFKLLSIIVVVTGKNTQGISISQEPVASMTDESGIEKRGGDSMFATGAVGRSFNRMGNYYGGRRAGTGSFANMARFGK